MALANSVLVRQPYFEVGSQAQDMAEKGSFRFRLSRAVRQPWPLGGPECLALPEPGTTGPTCPG
jgi:hypothetical protein